MKKIFFLASLVFSFLLSFGQGVIKISQLPTTTQNMAGGVTPVSVAGTTYGGYQPVVDSTIAELSSTPGNYTAIYHVLGYYAPGDGGGGDFYWVPIYSGSAVQGMVITTGGGAFVRIYDHKLGVNVLWFGGFPQDSVRFFTALQTAVNFDSVTYIPHGSYLYGGNGGAIQIPANRATKIYGDGANQTVFTLSPNADRAFDFNVAGISGQTFHDIEIYGITVNANNITNVTHGSNRYDHIIVGNLINGNVLTYFNNVYVHDVSAINVPITAQLSSPCILFGIDIDVKSAGSYATNITCRNVSIYGSDCGIVITGNAGTWLDNIVLDYCNHFKQDTVPSAFYPSSNFQVGQYAWVGRVTMTNCYGTGSGDPGAEIDNAMSFKAYNPQFKNAHTAGLYFKNFVAPAWGLSGPPTTTLNGSINSAVTSITVNSIPSAVDNQGWLEVGMEVMHYIVANSTTLTVVRGYNGSSAASASNGATVTFIENQKQQYTVYGGYVRDSNTVAGGGLWLPTINNLPGPKVALHDFTYERNGNSQNGVGEFVYKNGYYPEVILDNAQAVIAGDTSATAIYLSSTNDSCSQCLPERITIKNSTVSLAGTQIVNSGTTEGNNGIYVYGGWYQFSIDMTITQNMQGVTGQSNAINLSGSSVGSGKIKIKYNSQPGSDGQPVVVNFNSIVLDKGMHLDEDLSGMYYNNSSSTNYTPWRINTANSKAMTVGRLIHSPYFQSDTNAIVRNHRTIVTSTTYYAHASDGVIECNTVNGIDSIYLPPVTNGNSLTIPSPNEGIVIFVVDITGTSNTHNIVLTAASGDSLQRVLGGSFNIANAYQMVVLVSGKTGWQINTLYAGGDWVPKGNGLQSLGNSSFEWLSAFAVNYTSGGSIHIYPGASNNATTIYLGGGTTTPLMTFFGTTGHIMLKPSGGTLTDNNIPVEINATTKLDSSVTINGATNIDGALIYNVTTVSSTGTYQATSTDVCIMFTGTTATLAYPTAANGRHLVIINNGSGTLTIPTTTNASGSTITSVVATAGSNTIGVVYDGTNSVWRVCSH